MKKIDLREMIAKADQLRNQGKFGECILIQQQVMDLMTRKSSSTFYWVTVNFKPDVGLSTIQTVCQKFSDRKTIDRYWYSFEQRGDSLSTYGKGVHVHWVIIPIMGQRNVRDWFQSAFKHYVGNPAAIDIKSFPLIYLKDKLDYLGGIKWDTEKYVKVCTDRQWRKDFNLKPLYTNAEADTSDMVSETPI